MIWSGMIPVLAPFEVCEDLRFRELVTGQAPVSAPSTAQADCQADQRWGAGKGSQHPCDHERSPLKERPGLGPDAPPGTSGLGPALDHLARAAAVAMPATSAGEHGAIASRLR
jgi:hypothetical protein